MLTSANSHSSDALTSSCIDSEQLAQFLKASADALRLNILRVLQHDSFSVQELCQIFSLKQSAMSHHLKVLAAADLVTTRREGNTIFYRRKVFAHDHPFAALQQSLVNNIDSCTQSDHLQTGIHAVEQSRTQSSNGFFLENADKFRKQQDLIASFEQYAESVETLLKAVPTPAKQQAIEIGPGDGAFLHVLASNFEQVAAFDTAAAMLAQAEKTVSEQQLNNVQLSLGGTDVALKQKLSADCVVVNMVLHHIASPADIFTDCAKLLKSQGALLITDLCHHDQAWAKEACGDVWLGFEPEDLSYWAANAGFEEGQAIYLAQRNGFRIQIRHFIKH
jgi:ArsR family transcriptional regulator